MNPFDNPTEPRGGYSFFEKLGMLTAFTLFLVFLSWLSSVVF